MSEGGMKEKRRKGKRKRKKSTRANGRLKEKNSVRQGKVEELVEESERWRLDESKLSS